MCHGFYHADTSNRRRLFISMQAGPSDALFVFLNAVFLIQRFTEFLIGEYRFILSMRPDSVFFRYARHKLVGLL